MASTRFFLFLQRERVFFFFIAVIAIYSICHSLCYSRTSTTNVFVAYKQAVVVVFVLDLLKGKEFASSPRKM